MAVVGLVILFPVALRGVLMAMRRTELSAFTALLFAGRATPGGGRLAVA